jgi:hypothetical protein
MSAPLATPLAQLSDTSSFPGPAPEGSFRMGLTSRRIYGPTVVAEWVARRWFTRRGALLYAPSKCVTLFDLANAAADAADLASWRTTLTQEALKTPYVLACPLSIIRAARETSVDARLALVDGRVYPLMVNLLSASQAILTLPGS